MRKINDQACISGRRPGRNHNHQRQYTDGGDRKIQTLIRGKPFQPNWGLLKSMPITSDSTPHIRAECDGGSCVAMYLDFCVLAQLFVY